MHDDPGIYPPLPKREPSEDAWAAMVEPSRGTPFEFAWEFMLTHDLTDREGSAFWHGANLVYEALRETPMSDTEDEAWQALYDDTDVICTCDSCNHYSPTYEPDAKCALVRHVEAVVAARLTPSPTTLAATAETRSTP